MKTCRKCNQTFPLVEFYDHPTAIDRKQPYCKLCHRKHIYAARAAVRARKYGTVEAVLDPAMQERAIETFGNSYLGRHLERRKEEAEIQASLVCPDLQPRFLEGSAASNWNGMASGFLRQPVRSFSWSVR